MCDEQTDTDTRVTAYAFSANSAHSAKSAQRAGCALLTGHLSVTRDITEEDVAYIEE
jgi:hypothetical protein